MGDTCASPSQYLRSEHPMRTVCSHRECGATLAGCGAAAGSRPVALWTSALKGSSRVKRPGGHFHLPVSAPLLCLTNAHIFSFYRQVCLPLSIHTCCPQRSSGRRLDASRRTEEERGTLPLRKPSPQRRSWPKTSDATKPRGPLFPESSWPHHRSRWKTCLSASGSTGKNPPTKAKSAVCNTLA